MCTFFCFFFCEQKKQKKVPKKKKKRRTVFYVLISFCRFSFSAKAESLMFAIVLRTRSQLAPTLALPHWGGKNMPSTVQAKRVCEANVGWALSPTL